MGGHAAEAMRARRRHLEEAGSRGERGTSHGGNNTNNDIHLHTDPAVEKWHASTPVSLVERESSEERSVMNIN